VTVPTLLLDPVVDVVFLAVASVGYIAQLRHDRKRTA
jgi:hypothetical protein